MARTLQEIMANEKPEVVAQAQELATEMLLNIHLAELRESAALTQSELALAMGVKQPTISGMEKVGQDIKLSSLKKYIEAMGGKLRLDIEMPNGSHFETDTPRTHRALSFNGLEVLLRSHRQTPKVKSKTLEPFDTIPTKNVGSFVIELAEHHNVSYTYNSMDQFADSVTTLAGDDVKQDNIEDLLVALKRAGKLSMQQVAQLSVNYLRERHSSV